MFGQGGNPSFGFNQAAQSSPFGQSAFGRTTATTSFGTSAAPVFGSTSLFSAQPAGPATGNLFGSTTTTPAFGASTATPSSSGGFGATTTTQPLFGAQPSANTSLFGTTNAAPAFGQTAAPTAFGFGQTTNTGLFGQPQPAAQQATAFGQTTTATQPGLFGSNTGFAGASAVGMAGAVVKFQPVTGSDTMVKNGVTQTISTRHYCITCMKEYESKSLEELRLEDYTAGRKGAAQGQAPQGLFSATAQSSPFGATVTNSNTSNAGFGAMTSGFGTTSQAGSTNLFSKPITGFGAPSTTTSSFAFNTAPATNVFNSQSKPFGATTSTSLFAANNTAPMTGSAFGNSNTLNTGFGTNFATSQPNQSIGLFSQSKPAFTMPTSSATTNFGFSQPTATNANSLFSQKPLGTGFGTPFSGATTSTFQTANTGFGQPQSTTSTLFNNPASTVSAGLGSGGTSLFNSAAKPSLFGTTNTMSPFNTTGGFGTMPTLGGGTNTMQSLGTNMFGTGTSMNTTQQGTGTAPVHQQILALLVSTPFGDSPLLRNLLPASGKSEQFLKPPTSMCKGLSSPQYKLMTSSTSPRLKPQPVTSIPAERKSFFDGLEEDDPLLEAFQPRPNAKRLVLRPKSNSFNESNDKGVSKNDQSNDNSTAAEAATPPQMLDKENRILQDNSKLMNDRRSSSSWLKSSFPRTTRAVVDQSTSQTESDAPLSAEALENTVAEFS